MSDLDQSISSLERELALKKGYQAVKFVLPKSIPDDVATEIQSKLREIAESMALSKGQLSGGSTSATSVFTDDEVSILKMVITSVQQKTQPLNSGPVEIPVSAAPQAVNGRVPASPGGASVHKPKNYGAPRKAKILTAENVRGEGKRFTAPDDDLHVPNPEKVDDHGMVAATLLKKGMMIRLPVEDLEWIE